MKSGRKISGCKNKRGRNTTGCVHTGTAILGSGKGVARRGKGIICSRPLTPWLPSSLLGIQVLLEMEEQNTGAFNLLLSGSPRAFDMFLDHFQAWECDLVSLMPSSCVCVCARAWADLHSAQTRQDPPIKLLEHSVSHKTAFSNWSFFFLNLTKTFVFSFFRSHSPPPAPIYKGWTLLLINERTLPSLVSYSVESI